MALDAQIEESSAGLEQADLLRALRAFKGIKTLTSATIVAEIGDLRRFPSAGKFASFLNAKKALVAVARELACVIWAVGQEDDLTA